jgi:hypothetical protein
MVSQPICFLELLSKSGGVSEPTGLFDEQEVPKGQKWVTESIPPLPSSKPRGYFLLENISLYSVITNSVPPTQGHSGARKTQQSLKLLLERQGVKCQQVWLSPAVFGG